jgi:hypothetical protein
MGKEPECSERMDAQDVLLGKEPECSGRMDAQELPPPCVRGEG